MGIYKPFDKANVDKFTLADFNNPYLIEVAKAYEGYSADLSSITINDNQYNVSRIEYQGKVYLGILDMTLEGWKALPKRNIPVSLKLIIVKKNGSSITEITKQFELSTFFEGVIRTTSNITDIGISPNEFLSLIAEKQRTLNEKDFYDFTKKLEGLIIEWEGEINEIIKDNPYVITTKDESLDGSEKASFRLLNLARPNTTVQLYAREGDEEFIKSIMYTNLGREKLIKVKKMKLKGKIDYVAYTRASSGKDIEVAIDVSNVEILERTASEFIKDTPFSITKNEKNMTEIQFEKYLQELKGKYVKWNGIVEEVDNWGIFASGLYNVSLKRIKNEYGYQPKITLEIFDEEIAFSLNKGQEISFTGRIREVLNFIVFTLYIDDVKIVN